MIIIQPECHACGQCAEVCKFHAITIIKTQGYSRFVINDNCVNCGMCKSNCLNEAIRDE